MIHAPVGAARYHEVCTNIGGGITPSTTPAATASAAAAVSAPPRGVSGERWVRGVGV